MALIFEAAVVWVYRRGKTEAVFFIIADFAIAVGVYGEIHSGRKTTMLSDELDRRSNLRVAEANARASALELEAAKQREKSALAEQALIELQRKIEDRHIDEERYSAINDAIPIGAEYSVKMFCVGATTEPCQFAAELSAILGFFEFSVTFDPQETAPETPIGDIPGFLIRARDSETSRVWFNILKAAGIKGGVGTVLPTLAPDEVQLIIGERWEPRRMK